MSALGADGNDTLAGRGLRLAAALAASLNGARRALAGLRWQDAAYFLFTGLLAAGINAVWGIEMQLKTGEIVGLLYAVLFPLLTGPVVMIGWVLADRGAAPGTLPDLATAAGRRARLRRVAIALVLSVTVAVFAVPALLGLVDIAMPVMLKSDGKEYLIPHWAMQAGLWLDVAIYSGLTIAVLEIRRLRESRQAVLQAALGEQAQLSRQLLESRLAAMQAQVEPQFLFDSLVDVQATYDRRPADGAQVMDRLINYLRVALPRLREQGSTVQAEVELLAAYLGVVAARHEGRPHLQFVVAPDAAGARFYPMLLLPLAQRAVRLTQDRGGVPAWVELVVKRHGDELGVLLRIDAGGLCEDDPELARVRERLAGLYADRAELRCSDGDTGTRGCSEFVLRVPLTPAS